MGFRPRRTEGCSWIEKNHLNGVVLLSADRHRSDARKIERPSGYALYDFMSSHSTNVHTHELVPGALFGYNEKCSFGLLTCDTKRADPQITYAIVNIDGKIIDNSLSRASAKASSRHRPMPPHVKRWPTDTFRPAVAQTDSPVFERNELDRPSAHHLQTAVQNSDAWAAPTECRTIGLMASTESSVSALVAEHGDTLAPTQSFHCCTVVAMLNCSRWCVINP